MRQVWGDQEQVNWADRTSRSKGKNPHSPSVNQPKGSHQTECNYCGASLVTLEKSVAQSYLRSTRVGTVAKKSMFPGSA